MPAQFRQPRRSAPPHLRAVECEVGKTIGPIAGPDGWFIARINTRTPAGRQIDVKNERERELVKEDYITTRFFQWAAEVIGKAKFE